VAVDAPGLLWFVRVAWLALPFTLLEHLEEATSGADGAVWITAQVLFWVLWAVAFGVSLVPLPSTLTALRILVPLAPAASIAAAAVQAPGPGGWIGLAAGTLAAVAAHAAPVGDWFVDGASYGDERRFALRPPVALLLGPVPLTWVLTVGPLPAGALLLAGGAWALGGILVAVGLVTAWWGSFALWRLARRWAVFVPAGLTLVDDMALAEPVLLPATDVTRVGPAHVGTTARDLTVGAPGLVIEIALSAPLELVPAAGADRTTEAVAVHGVLVVPSRPGTLLAHAEERGVPVARD
jgi:hypothetical protein